MNRKQYKLRTLLTWFVVMCVVLSAIGSYIHQRRMRNAAFLELGRMGFRYSIGPSANQPPTRAMQIRYERPSPLSRRDAERAVRHLQALCKRYDLGLSKGDNIELVSFEGSRQDAAVVGLFQDCFPEAAVGD